MLLLITYLDFPIISIKAARPPISAVTDVCWFWTKEKGQQLETFQQKKPTALLLWSSSGYRLDLLPIVKMCVFLSSWCKIIIVHWRSLMGTHKRLRKDKMNICPFTNTHPSEIVPRMLLSHPCLLVCSAVKHTLVSFVEPSLTSSFSHTAAVSGCFDIRL